MIQDHEGNAPQNAANTHNRGQLRTIQADKTRHHALLTYERAASHSPTYDDPGTVSLAPNELTTRQLPYWLLDMEPDAAVAYAVLARDADVMQAPAILTDPAIVVCPSPLPDWTTPRLNSELQRGLRDLLVQGLAWSLQPHALDGLVPPYALYWSHVIPTAEILATLQAQSRAACAERGDGR